MAQSGYTPILIYASGTATNVPLAANLTSSASGAELALNYADGKLYYKNSAGVVTLLASAAGSLGDVVGPASATDNALARFDTTTGKLIQNSVGILSDTGALSGITDIAASGSITLSGGTANGVAYLNGSKVLTTGSALTFDGTNLSAGSTSQNLGTSTARWGTVYASTLADGTDQLVGSSGTTVRFGFGASWSALGFGIGGTEQMRLTSTGLGIGTSSPAVKLDVFGTAAVIGAGRYVINASDSTAMAQGVGGGINFRYLYISADSTTLISGASISAYKENATSGNYASALIFCTRANSSSQAEQMRLDSSGNLGLGVTPSAWGSTSKALQFSTGAFEARSASFSSNTNAYFNAGWLYVGTGRATLYNQTDGQHVWYNSASGTAGNAITFTQAMTLTAAGDLGVGVTSPTSRLHVNHPTASTNAIAQFTNGTTGSGAGNGLYVGIDGSNEATIFNFYNSAIKFATNGTERMRLDSSGNLAIGGTSSFGARLYAGSANGTTYGSTAQLRLSGRSANNRASIIFTDDNTSDGTISYVPNTTAASRYFSFSARGTESDMILDGSGNLLVGTTSSLPSFANGRIEAAVAASSYGLVLDATASSASGIGIRGNDSTTALSFFNAQSGATVGTVVINSSSTSYNTSSDYRLKENIQPMTGALAKVAALKPCIYKWKADGSDGEGFIAHELAEVCPHAVTGEKDGIDAEGNPKYQGIDTSFLVATLTAAIQELKAEFDAYKASHP